MVEILKLDFEVDAWSDHDGQDSKDEIGSRFVEKLVIRPKEVTLVKQNSTLRSVVPLAMFEHKQQNAGLNLDSRYDWLSCITFGGSLSVLDGIYISP